MCKSLSIFIKVAQACLSSYCMWWHALQPRWKCPVHLLEKLNNLFVSQLILDLCTLLILCTAQLSLKAAVLRASNSFAWHPPVLHYIVMLCFQNKTKWRIDTEDVWEKYHDLGYRWFNSATKLQKQFHLATTKVRTQRKKFPHDITVLWGVKLNMYKVLLN